MLHKIDLAARSTDKDRLPIAPQGARALLGPFALKLGLHGAETRQIRVPKRILRLRRGAGYHGLIGRSRQRAPRDVVQRHRDILAVRRNVNYLQRQTHADQ